MGLIYRRRLRRVEQMMKTLETDLEWFHDLPKRDQFEIAARMVDSEKIGIQKLKLFLDIIPWLIAAIALLTR